MLKPLMGITLAALLASPVAMAADKAATPQQNKMGECNKQAAGKKGDERKAFMSDCLKAKPAEAAPAPEAKPLAPKEAMGACNKAATEKTLKGDDRKKFMSDCLKAKGPALMSK